MLRRIGLLNLKRFARLELRSASCPIWCGIVTG